MLWDHKTSPSLLLSVSLFSFVYMYHLSYSGTKMISIRFYGHRPSHRGGTVRSFFHDLIVYKGHCTHWKTVKQLWLSSLRKKFPNKKKCPHCIYVPFTNNYNGLTTECSYKKCAPKFFFITINSHNIWKVSNMLLNNYIFIII